MLELAFHALELLVQTMASPAKPGKAATARGTSFNDKHTSWNMVLSLSARTLKPTISISWPEDSASRVIEGKIWDKRQKTVCKKPFGRQFLPDNYRLHLTLQHPAQWAEYQLMSDSGKPAFFDFTIPFVNTIVSHMDIERDHITYRIEKRVIDVVIEEMLWDTRT